MLVAGHAQHGLETWPGAARKEPPSHDVSSQVLQMSVQAELCLAELLGESSRTPARRREFEVQWWPNTTCLTCPRYGIDILCHHATSTPQQAAPRTFDGQPAAVAPWAAQPSSVGQEDFPVHEKLQQRARPHGPVVSVFRWLTMQRPM